ncbi:MAG: hypothetical protein RIK85_09460 [Marinobacter sp.]
MPTTNHPDIVVIGGGILGCAIARYLSRTPGLGEQTTSHVAGSLA